MAQESQQWTTDATGQGSLLDIRQPYATTNYLICTEGTYPSRNLTASSDAFIGGISAFAGTNAPEGYALCNGQLLNISQYEALFSIIGTQFGGDGISTFALPDLRGRVPVGRGQGPGLSAVALGERIGSESKAISGLTAHSHTTGAGANTEEAGSSASLQTTMPGLGLTPLIAIQGMFPSRALSLDSSLGDIAWFAGDFAPMGWALADGSTLPISQYQDLFALLGTQFGGNGITDFALPDLRGRIAIGAGSGPGLTPVVAGEFGGENSQTLSPSQLAAHAHELGSDIVSGSSGSSQAISLMQPWLAITTQIATQGLVQPISSTMLQAPNASTGHQLSGFDEYAGSIGLTGYDYATTNTLLADGQNISTQTDAALFSTIGFTYGGNGSSYFTLPDLRGRALIGSQNGSAGIGLSAYPLGSTGGAESIVIPLNALESHSHGYAPAAQLVVEAGSVTTLSTNTTNAPNISEQLSGVIEVDGTLQVSGTLVNGISSDGFGIINNNGTITIDGELNNQESDGKSAIINNNGTITINSGTLINNGTISGTGVINGDVINNGSLSPGNSAGHHTIRGDLSLGKESDLQIEMAGTADGRSASEPSVEHDWISASGTTQVGGELRTSTINNYRIEADDTFRIIRSSTPIEGRFENLEEGDPVTGTTKGESLFITYKGGNGADIELYSIEVSYVHGSTADDILKGDKKNNKIYGSGGNDLIYGAQGEDTLFGGEGDDLLYGGNGRDHFMVTDKDGVDWIMDFNANEDDIWIGDNASSFDIDRRDGMSLISVDGELRCVAYGSVLDRHIIMGS